MSYEKFNKILKEIRCKNCSSFFLWCWKRGSDFRCDRCRNKGCSVEEVEKELAEMSTEEYQEIMNDIEEYNKNNK